MSIPWHKNIPALSCDKCGKIIYNQNRWDHASKELEKLAVAKGWRVLNKMRTKHFCPNCITYEDRVRIALIKAKEALEYDPDFVDCGDVRSEAWKIISDVLEEMEPST